METAGMDYETKADTGTDVLEASFDAVAAEAAIGALKAELGTLRQQVEARVRADGRPALTGAKSEDGTARAFVERYLRQGAMAGVELKSFVGTSDGAGGYAVPEEIDARIDAVLKSISPIRSLANVVKVGSAGYRKLITTGGVASGWAAEDGVRPLGETPTFVEVAPPMGDLYANPAASQAMLDDAAFDVEDWLAREIAAEFARAEGAAFVNGSGINRPKGFLNYPMSTASDATRPFGTVQVLPTGVAGAFPVGAADKLIDLVQALRAPYRQGASFVMNAATSATIRKFKTADGAFLWQPGLAAGQPDSLLGYPVVESEDMPDIEAGSLSIAFGNFAVGYLIAERRETGILRDPYSNKPFVHFYATKRIGGGVANSEAIKLMRFSAA
ncbi:phage major capsid protein [Sphingomonas jatrophae]|uniref:Phage major capsid protein, HK97 family n=1 Tax=Sphingomonas jatrophae TaxID=1166337 RepID=A0A1I6L3Q5_9SPHN|nr:phage major capsid protein [Sphingomonas jatrophae]SFR98064.1 phage major capsid protein, HK97 family [Sphingomonas jatrophae]